jgi:hypothetical protein
MCRYHDTLSGITLKLYYDGGKDISDMMRLVVDQRFYLHTARAPALLAAFKVGRRKSSTLEVQWIPVVLCWPSCIHPDNASGNQSRESRAVL